MSVASSHLKSTSPFVLSPMGGDSTLKPAEFVGPSNWFSSLGDSSNLVGVVYCVFASVDDIAVGVEAALVAGEEYKLNIIAAIPLNNTSAITIFRMNEFQWNACSIPSPEGIALLIDHLLV